MPILKAREPYIFVVSVSTTGTKSSRTRALSFGIVDVSGWWVSSPPFDGWGCGSIVALIVWLRPQVEEKARDRLRVVELAEMLLDLGRSPADDRELLVFLGARCASFDVLREKDVHSLAAESGRRVERAELAPSTPG